ncbi:MAG TPA: hypothetical protein VFS66_09825 [Acidimicrobiia bacterium]|nr:hypothetical protein [Acidimicrobiia bacterium]
MASIQFVLAGALAMVMFVTLANLVVVQYGRGAIRSALEQGARAGSVGGPTACRETAAMVVADLLGGAMSDGLSISCEAVTGSVMARADATFQAWIPLMPSFHIQLESRATEEP